MKEVELGRYAGPFEEIPFKNVIQSPIGLVPKAGGKMRLIFHLSYEFDNRGSVNSNTNKMKCSMHYRDLDYAVKCCLDVLEKDKTVNGQKTVRFSKSDLTSAFRILPMKVSQRCWLVMMAIDPISKKKMYFVDKCLPFRSSISCAQFQKFSDAFQHTEFKLRVTLRITNYFDDFLFVAKTIWLCDYMMNKFLIICEDIGCPVSKEKTETGCEIIIFLGTLLDGDDHCLAIVEEKKDKAIQQLTNIVKKRTVLVKDIQSLTGLLNFLTRAIVLGRAFTWHLFTKIPSYIYSMQQKKLKFYHHVT